MPLQIIIVLSIVTIFCCFGNVDFCKSLGRVSKMCFLFAEAINKTDEESDILHRQLLDREIDLTAFVQKYKKLRNTYHRRALTHLAAKTSLNG